MSGKKILFFLPLPPPIHGAALRNKSLVESKSINESFIVNVLPFNFAKESEDIGHLSLGKLWQGLIRVFQIIGRIFFFKPDLVYFNVSLYGFALFRDYVYVMIFKLFGCRILFHLRTQGVKQQVLKSHSRKKLFRTMFKDTYIICLSQFLSKDIEDVYDGIPFVINNGIKDVSTAFPRTTGVSDRPVILFLANLAKAKGVLELLDALSMINEKNIPFEALFVGAPVDIQVNDLERRIADLSLSQNAKVLGPIFGEGKYELLRSADVYTLPTYFEAFPGTVLEAMQFSLPVVSTFEGAIPEIVDNGKTGFLVQKHDRVGLAEKLQILLGDPALRAAFGTAGREKFLKYYTMETFERNMKETFEDVISR